MDAQTFLEAEIRRNEKLATVCTPEMRKFYAENIETIRQIIMDEKELAEHRDGKKK